MIAKICTWLLKGVFMTLVSCFIGYVVKVLLTLILAHLGITLAPWLFGVIVTGITILLESLFYKWLTPICKDILSILLAVYLWFVASEL